MRRPRRIRRRVGWPSASARLAERQTDLEEARHRAYPCRPPAGRTDNRRRPRSASRRRTASRSAELERVETPKGTYLAFRKRQRGRAAVDALPDVLTGLLRGLSFPKHMNWDAWLEDGKGAFTFGRPIRWILFLYGGRVVPYDIRRTRARRGPARAGRPERRRDVRTSLPDDERARRTSRQGQDVRRLSRAPDGALRDPLSRGAPRAHRPRAGHARPPPRRARAPRGRGPRRTARGGAGSSSSTRRSSPGTFTPDFLDLPEEVLTTTMIHHQHYLPGDRRERES